MNYLRGAGMFGSAFLGAHLMRGAAAAALIAWAIVHQTAHPWLSLGAGIAALVALMSRWPGCPQELMVAKDAVVDMDDRSEFGNFVANVIDFYFRTFTARYERLPTVPTSPSLFRG